MNFRKTGLQLEGFWTSRNRKLKAVVIFVDFSITFDSIHRTKMKYIILAYEIFFHDNTECLNILAGVLKNDTTAPFLLMICLQNVLRIWIDFSKELCLLTRKIKNLKTTSYKHHWCWLCKLPYLSCLTPLMELLIFDTA